MIAYLMTTDDGTEGIVITDDTIADADSAIAARRYYVDRLVEQGINARDVTYGVSALFEGVTLFRMENAK